MSMTSTWYNKNGTSRRFTLFLPAFFFLLPSALLSLVHSLGSFKPVSSPSLYSSSVGGCCFKMRINLNMKCFEHWLVYRIMGSSVCVCVCVDSCVITMLLASMGFVIAASMWKYTIYIKSPSRSCLHLVFARKRQIASHWICNERLGEGKWWSAFTRKAPLFDTLPLPLLREQYVECELLYFVAKVNFSFLFH